MPVNKSRLNLWKLPEEGSAFSKAPGASSAGPGKPGNQGSGLGFDDNPWTQSGSNSGWPDSNKASSGNISIFHLCHFFDLFFLMFFTLDQFHRDLNY